MINRDAVRSQNGPDIPEIFLLSSGHQALDHRVFDKEAVSLAAEFPAVTVVAAHPVNETVRGVRIIALPPYRSRWERFLRRPLQCYRAAWGRGRNRVLILHDAELLAWAPLVKLFTGWRIIYDVHEDFSHLLRHRGWIPPFLRRAISGGIALLEHILALSCDGVIGVTATLTEHFPHRQRAAIYNLPSRDFIASAAGRALPMERRSFDVVHLGTLSPSRLDFLIEVLTELLRRRPAARGLVIGVRPEQEALLRQHFPGGEVTIFRHTPYGEIAGLLGNCRIGINLHPVLHPHLRCAVPVKVFEYMAAGCAVVTSRLPELDRLLGEEGKQWSTVISDAGPNRYAEAILALLEHPETMREHGMALMRMVRTQWNWDHEGEKLIRFVSGLLPGKESRQSEQIPDHQC